MTPQHEGVIALSSKPSPAVEPAPGPVNMHPGPDLDTLRRVRDSLLALPGDDGSTERNEAA
jgi:hypothetical protein